MRAGDTLFEGVKIFPSRDEANREMNREGRKIAPLGDARPATEKSKNIYEFSEERADPEHDEAIVENERTTGVNENALVAYENEAV